MALMEKTAKSLFGVYVPGDKAGYADKGNSVVLLNIMEF